MSNNVPKGEQQADASINSIDKKRFAQTRKEVRPAKRRSKQSK